MDRNITATDVAIAAEPVHDNRIGIGMFDTVGRTTRYFYTTGILTNWTQTSGITSLNEVAENSDEATRKLVESLLAITGVTKISWLETNRLILNINPMYFWNQVQDQVIEALLQRLDWDRSDVSLLSYADFQEFAKQHDLATLPESRFS